MSGFTVIASNSTDTSETVLPVAADASCLSRRQIEAYVFEAKAMRADCMRAFFHRLGQTLARIAAGRRRTSGSLLRRPAAAGN